LIHLLVSDLKQNTHIEITERKFGMICNFGREFSYQDKLSHVCRFMEHEAVLVDMHVKPGVPWQLCPRSTLRRLSESLKKEYGLVVRAGFESEFYLMKQSTG
jgi:hypothetical protein